MKQKNYQPLLPRLNLGQKRQITPIKIKQFEARDNRKLESIIEQRKFQNHLLDYVTSNASSEQQSQNNMTKDDILKNYTSVPGKPTLLREKALKGIHPMDQKNQLKVELHKLDQKVQLMNERNPLQESWKSPFLTQNKSTATLRAIESKQVDLSASQEIDEGWQNTVLLNENFKGFGLRLKSFLDFDKHCLFDKLGGNPKYLYRNQIIRIIKIHSTSALDLVKQWNILSNQDKLRPQLKMCQKLLPGRSQQQFGTISSISHYYSIQDFYKSKKVLQHSSSQNTPQSIISPQFVVKNSRQSNQSSNKDIQLDFGKTVQEQIVGEFLDDDPLELQDISIHRDTFLTYCQIFWDLVRKEDEIVERIVWGFCKSDQFTFNGFKHFYKLLVFGAGTVEEYIKFVFEFFLGKDRNEVPFLELQGLLKLLMKYIDGQLKADNQLSDQILMDIVNQIHRPQNIQKDILWQLIYDDKIPATLIIRLLYDQNN